MGRGPMSWTSFSAIFQALAFAVLAGNAVFVYALTCPLLFPKFLSNVCGLFFENWGPELVHGSWAWTKVVDQLFGCFSRPCFYSFVWKRLFCVHLNMLFAISKGFVEWF